MRRPPPLLAPASAPSRSAPRAPAPKASSRPASARLSHLVLRPAGYKVYATLTYTLQGPIPPGLDLRRHAVLNLL
jgi:hypothetical protein